MFRKITQFLTVLFLVGMIPALVHATIHTITLSNFNISPKNTAVLLGDTVRWVTSSFHTSTSDPNSPKQWDSDIITSSYTLIVLPTDSTGNYPYRCTLHAQMIDTLRVSAPPPPCCVAPIRGDANGTNSVNVLDINYLVAYFFNGGPAPLCNQEADVNGNGGINVLDLNFLIAFCFSGGPPPAVCP